MSGPKRVRRPSRGREAAIFAAATALCFDLLLIGFSLWASPSVRGQFALLAGWDLVKGAGVVLGLSAVALRARSMLLGIFAIVLGLIVILEETTGYALAIGVLDRLGIDATAIVAGAPAFLYGELAVLGGLALLAGLAVWAAPTPSPQLSIVRRHLLILLAALFVFAVGIGFLGELWSSPGWKLVEEIGESAVLSLILGYVIGLLVAPPHQQLT